MIDFFLAVGPALAVDASLSSREARLRAISEHWGSDTTVSMEWLLIAVGLLLLLIAGLSLRAWWRNRHLRSSPLTVFNQVATACRLSAGERLLLWRIARQQSLASPLTLMLSPTTLRHHGRSFGDRRSRAGQAFQMRRVARLRRKLFAESDAWRMATAPADDRL